MRKNFVKTFALLNVIALAFGTNFAALKASAETEQTTTPTTTEDNTFEMEKSASVRVNRETPGIRFMVNIGDDFVGDLQEKDEFGFLIFPQVYLTYDGVSTMDLHNTLHDFVEVKATTPETIAETIYWDEEDSTYRANGVLHSIGEANLDLEFSSVAYYKVGEAYTYATFDPEFSRSYAYIAQQAYIGQPELRNTLMSVCTFLAGDEFEIRNSKDMYELSTAVAGNEEKGIAPEAFEGITFGLTRTIAVGSDYVAVPENFAGTWNWNAYALLVVDNEVGRGFASDAYNKKATFSWIDHRNGVAVMSSKLIDGETAKFWTENSEYVGTKVDSVAVDASVTNAESQADYVNYTGAATFMTLGDGNGAKSTNHYLAIKTNNWALPSTHSTIVERGATEMEAIKELYTSVKFRFYVSVRPNVGGRLYGSSNGGLTQAMNYINNAKPYSEGYWFEWTCTIDELIDFCATRGTNTGICGTNLNDWYEGQTATAFNGAYLLPLGRIGARLGYQQNLYIGDCVFVK